MRQFYFHIGMPKSASSYLQKAFFPLLDIDYLGKHYASDIDFKEKHAPFEEKFREIFIRQPYNITNDYLEELHSLASGTNNKILYSNEGLFGSYLESFRNNFQISHNLKIMFDNPKLIIVLRRQDTFIESLYRQAIRNGYWKSAKNFISYKNRCFGSYRIDNREQVDLTLLNYNDFISFCCEMFGRENLLILPYELFKLSRDTFLKEIANFLGVPFVAPITDSYVNKSDHYLYLNILKILNFISHKRNIFTPINYLQRNVRDLPGNKKLISTHLQKDILDFFEQSNMSLAKGYNLDLKRFDYY